MTESYYKLMRDAMLCAVSRLQQKNRTDHSFFEKWELCKNEGQRLWEDGEPEPVEYLARLFLLDDFERFCLTALTIEEMERGIFCLPEELETAYHGALCIQKLMTLYDGERCFSESWYRSFLSGGRLSGLLLTDDKADGPSLFDPVKLDGRIRNLMLAGQWDDPELERSGFWIWPGEDQDLVTGGFGETQYRRWSGMIQKQRKRHIFLLKGPKGIGKKSQVRRFASQSGHPVFCADGRCLALLAQEDERKMARQMVRECQIQQALLCIGQADEMIREESKKLFLEDLCRQALSCLPAVILLQDGEETALNIKGEVVQIVFPMPDLMEAAFLWQEIGKGYPGAKEIPLDEFAGVMLMTPGQIRRTFNRAVEIMEWGRLKYLNTALLKEACSGYPESHLADKAVRVEVKYGFPDLILPAAQKMQLREACSQVKNRYQVYERWGFGEKAAYGLGISIVFSGPPGTGKTMAAQVMAEELGLEIYKIDLSAVVSKYIGETEKNLNTIFREGRKSQVILFFDEADVLFSKRTEVKDSHDKYNNMEAAFMLQKMEEYTGVVILATNYLQNIDEAFKRRITYLINFPLPDCGDRKKLWQSVIPAKLPLGDDMDLDFLAARFEMSGSQIKNSITNAAFLAAQSGAGKIIMKHVLQAVRMELAKSGKKLTREDMGEYCLWLEETGDENDPQ